MQLLRHDYIHFLILDERSELLKSSLKSLSMEDDIQVDNDSMSKDIESNMRYSTADASSGRGGAADPPPVFEPFDFFTLPDLVEVLWFSVGLELGRSDGLELLLGIELGRSDGLELKLGPSEGLELGILVGLAAVLNTAPNTAVRKADLLKDMSMIDELVNALIVLGKSN
jgi:hypothetical protein